MRPPSPDSPQETDTEGAVTVVTVDDEPIPPIATTDVTGQRTTQLTAENPRTAHKHWEDIRDRMAGNGYECSLQSITCVKEASDRWLDTTRDVYEIEMTVE
jgi:hypothetical protein